MQKELPDAVSRLFVSTLQAWAWMWTAYMQPLAKVAMDQYFLCSWGDRLTCICSSAEGAKHPDMLLLVTLGMRFWSALVQA